MLQRVVWSPAAWSLLACLFLSGCSQWSSVSRMEPSGALQAGLDGGGLSPSKRVAQAPTAHEAELPPQLSLARLREANGDVQGATALYREYLQKHPQHAFSQHRLAVMAAQNGRFDEAHEHFQVALQSAPDDVPLLSDIGYAYFLENRLGEAESVLRQALELNPQHAAANNNLGLVLGQQGRISESLAAFRVGGTPAQAHANIAFVHSQRGEIDEAQKHYSRALSLDSTLRPAARAMLQLAGLQQAQRSVPARDAKQKQAPSKAGRAPAATVLPAPEPAGS